jgi:hypothetical protein
MSLVLVGLNQHTAPVALRERLSRALEPSGCSLLGARLSRIRVSLDL